jgi:hypothetical protein
VNAAARSMYDSARFKRKLRVLLGAGTTGAAVLLVARAVMPKLAREITPTQRIWLRDTFAAHTGWVLGAMLAATAVLALPVLLVALWMLRRERRSQGLPR